MSLESWLAKKWLGKKLRTLEKEGRMDWLGKNKAKIGGFLVAFGTSLRAVPDVPHVIIEVVTFVGTFLVGGGFVASDSAVKKFGDEAR